jgi:hypothetical protein
MSIIMEMAKSERYDDQAYPYLAKLGMQVKTAALQKTEMSI